MLTELPHYLTTRELADLIRVKERKVYDLAAAGEIPHSRATGKLLFPRDAVLAWIDRSKDATEALAPRPSVVLGSHDPLLEWALRESESGLASLFGGSLDGLERFTQREGLATALHVAGDNDDWNIGLVERDFRYKPAVLIEWAWRRRGLIVPAGNPLHIHSLRELSGRSLVQRQKAAGSHVLLQQKLVETGMDRPGLIEDGPLAGDEREAAQAVFDGRADAAFGLETAARQSGLGFVPICEERFDILFCRRAYFEPPVQKLLDYCQSEAFRDTARRLGGYRIDGLGTVRFNGS